MTGNNKPVVDDFVPDDFVPDDFVADAPDGEKKNSGQGSSQPVKLDIKPLPKFSQKESETDDGSSTKLSLKSHYCPPDSKYHYSNIPSVQVTILSYLALLLVLIYLFKKSHDRFSLKFKQIVFSLNKSQKIIYSISLFLLTVLLSYVIAGNIWDSEVKELTTGFKLWELKSWIANIDLSMKLKYTWHVWFIAILIQMYVKNKLWKNDGKVIFLILAIRSRKPAYGR